MKRFIDDVEVLNFSVKGDCMIVQILINNEHMIIVPLIVWTILFINMSYDSVCNSCFFITSIIYLYIISQSLSSERHYLTI